MISTHRNNILELFASYRVEAPDGLIDSLTFYVEGEVNKERDWFFKQYTDAIHHVRGEDHEQH